MFTDPASTPPARHENVPATVLRVKELIIPLSADAPLLHRMSLKPCDATATSVSDGSSQH